MNILPWSHFPVHTQTLSGSPLPLTLSLWPWAGFASGCCWDFCAGGWRADGESLGQGSHNFHPSIHPFVWLMNERKVSPLLWQMAVEFWGTHEDFIYNEVPLWIPALSTTSFIFRFRVNAVRKWLTDHRDHKAIVWPLFVPNSCRTSAAVNPVSK